MYRPKPATSVVPEPRTTDAIYSFYAIIKLDSLCETNKVYRTKQMTVGINPVRKVDVLTLSMYKGTALFFYWDQD